MADCVFGIVGKDFVIIASDRSVNRSVLKIQDCDEKLTTLSDNILIGVSGLDDVSSRKGFSKLIKGESEYYYYRYNNRLNTYETANFTRSVLANNIRKGGDLANCLIAGFENNEPSLYWLDYLGSLQKVTRGCQGYCSYFLNGLLDNCYKKVNNIFLNQDFTFNEAFTCVSDCIREMKTRFVLNTIDFTVKVIDKV